MHIFVLKKISYHTVADIFICTKLITDLEETKISVLSFKKGVILFI